MTILLFSAPLWGEGEKEEKLSRNNYVVYLTNDTLSEMMNYFRSAFVPVAMTLFLSEDLSFCLSGF